MPENGRINELVERIQTAHRELEQELDHLADESRKRFHYELQRDRVVFDEAVRQLHRQQRTGLWQYLREADLLTVLSAPIIYGMVIPLAFLDLTITAYQHICFRIYRIPRVSRREYIVIDRQHLPYLNAIEKLNCVYCGYGNGLIAYAREIIARTEQYWCPIRHARRVAGQHERVKQFLDYGDAEGWKKRLPELRRRWDDGAE